MSFEDDTYSTMFSALKHPIRRKILRLIFQKSITYTEILNSLRVENGVLNYHLDNMKDLITKNEKGLYSLSEFGLAALNVIDRVEEPKPKLVNPPHYLKGILIVLIITSLSLSGFSLFYYNQYQNKEIELMKINEDLNSLSQQYDEIAIFKQLINTTRPATFTTSGMQIVSSTPMQFKYLRNPDDSIIKDDLKSIIVFYVPKNNSIVHIEIAVDPVNNYNLEPTIQRGNAWRNESRVKIGTVKDIYNVTNPISSSLVFEAPIVWTFKSEGNGAFESPVLTEGWYTFSIFGPIRAINNPLHIVYPYFMPNENIYSYQAYVSFSILNNRKPIYYTASYDNS